MILRRPRSTVVLLSSILSPASTTLALRPATAHHGPIARTSWCIGAAHFGASWPEQRCGTQSARPFTRRAMRMHSVHVHAAPCTPHAAPRRAGRTQTATERVTRPFGPAGLPPAGAAGQTPPRVSSWVGVLAPQALCHSVPDPMARWMLG